MPEHTPGPWRVSTGLNIGYIISSEFGFVPIRTPFREDAFREGPGRASVSDATLDANAQLIAAAPELLDALEDMVIACEMQGIRFLGHAEALAAIAKAHGNCLRNGEVPDA